MRRVALLVALTLALGCASRSGGAWTTAGFEHRTFAWKVSYPPGTEDLLGGDWRLDNWRKDLHGAWTEKRGVAYSAIVDENGDGVIDQTERTYPALLDDLKFTNVRSNGIIWVKARKLRAGEAGKDLGVLLASYVTALSSGVDTAWRNLEAVVSSRSDVTLSGHPAISALVELRPRKEHADARVRYARVHLVLTKFDYLGPAGVAVAPSNDSRGARAVASVAGARARFTGLMAIGYVNDSAHFEGGLADVAKLLGRIELPLVDPTDAANPAALKVAAPANPTLAI